MTNIYIYIYIQDIVENLRSRQNAISQNLCKADEYFQHILENEYSEFTVNILEFFISVNLQYEPSGPEIEHIIPSFISQDERDYIKNSIKAITNAVDEKIEEEIASFIYDALLVNAVDYLSVIFWICNALRDNIKEYPAINYKRNQTATTREFVEKVIVGYYLMVAWLPRLHSLFPCKSMKKDISEKTEKITKVVNQFIIYLTPEINRKIIELNDFVTINRN